MLKKDANIWKHVVAKKSGLYGETDFKKKTVTVNKQYHKSKGDHADGIKKNKDGSANLLDTMVHEEMHKDHPKMHEKTVRKRTARKVKRLSRQSKNKFYNKYK